MFGPPFPGPQKGLKEDSLDTCKPKMIMEHVGRLLGCPAGT